jgi:hypothetical protein
MGIRASKSAHRTHVRHGFCLERVRPLRVGGCSGRERLGLGAALRGQRERRRIAVAFFTEAKTWWQTT